MVGTERALLVVPPWTTVVVAVADLGAVFTAERVAVFVMMLPAAAVTTTSIVILAVAPPASDPRAQLTVPVPPTEGWVGHEPWLGRTLANVVPPGTVSSTVTPVASPPEFVTVKVYLSVCKRSTGLGLAKIVMERAEAAGTVMETVAGALVSVPAQFVLPGVQPSGSPRSVTVKVKESVPENPAFGVYVRMRPFPLGGSSVPFAGEVTTV